MLTVSLGPFAMPLAPLLLLAAVWGAAWWAERLARRRGAEVATVAIGNTGFIAAGLGLLAARLAHVASQADLYLAMPLAVLDLRDGGWQPVPGLLAGFAWLVWQGWRQLAWRAPLVGGVLAGAAAWGSATLLLGVHDAPPVPALSLERLDDGARVALREQLGAGQPTVLNLWASWCGPCRAEMPMLAAAQQREAGRVRFVFVNQGESASAARAYLTDQDLLLQGVLLDPAARLGPALGSRGLPTTLFFDAQGRLADRHMGVLTEVSLRGKLRQLAAAPG
jgi:thiol-disulfide isomerase/thioredoxin